MPLQSEFLERHRVRALRSSSNTRPRAGSDTCRRCYEVFWVKGEFGIRREVPVCIASCYSIVPVVADRSGNKFALQSGWMGEDRISLRDGQLAPATARSRSSVT